MKKVETTFYNPVLHCNVQPRQLKVRPCFFVELLCHFYNTGIIIDNMCWNGYISITYTVINWKKLSGLHVLFTATVTTLLVMKKAERHTFCIGRHVDHTRPYDDGRDCLLKPVCRQLRDVFRWFVEMVCRKTTILHDLWNVRMCANICALNRKR